ncbi:MAG: diacylglycerol kinase family protein [Bacteroidia bacterium]|nr:diacylglycerol kinase family protein [Bacteroidia bacterium]
MKKSFSWKDRIKSFKPALNGLKFAISNEYNFRVQLIAAMLTIAVSAALNLSLIEWSIIIMCIGMVTGAEIFNSAIEHLVDLVSPEFQEAAGKVKDLAAGAVFILAFTALIIAIILLGSKLYQF